ncbi:MAG: deoxyribose-phosphate aldolase [Clostridiaceae bacterium]|nr:deoxyribose-phosphate aldolase [Clostridiaceae bacterium]
MIFTDEQKKILTRTDHTLLAVDATSEDIRKVCFEGVDFKTASICIPPLFVDQAIRDTDGRGKICTVIGFPNGYTTTESKVFETKTAVSQGAHEIDMVISVGYLKQGDLNAVKKDISAVRAACKGRVLKVIIETCLLSEAEKIQMCKIVSDVGADFIKTSTGFSTGGATLADVALFKANLPPDIKIKASGGIATLEDAEAFIEAGADRIGSSRIVRLVRQQMMEAQAVTIEV